MPLKIIAASNIQGEREGSGAEVEIGFNEEAGAYESEDFLGEVLIKCEELDGETDRVKLIIEIPKGWDVRMGGVKEGSLRQIEFERARDEYLRTGEVSGRLGEFYAMPLFFPEDAFDIKFSIDKLSGGSWKKFSNVTIQHYSAEYSFFKDKLR